MNMFDLATCLCVDILGLKMCSRPRLQLRMPLTLSSGYSWQVQQHSASKPGTVGAIATAQMSEVDECPALRSATNASEVCACRWRGISRFARDLA